MSPVIQWDGICFTTSYEMFNLRASLVTALEFEFEFRFLDVGYFM